MNISFIKKTSLSFQYPFRTYWLNNYLADHCLRECEGEVEKIRTIFCKNTIFPYTLYIHLLIMKMPHALVISDFGDEAKIKTLLH